MDLANEEHITNSRTPEQIEGVIHELVRVISEDSFELPAAWLLGVSFREERHEMRSIAMSRDVHQLLDDPGNKLEASLFDAVALIICGWATPCVAPGDNSLGLTPRQSPHRARVRATLIAEAEDVSIVVRFADKPGDVTVDKGYGPLSDALLDFWVR